MKTRNILFSGGPGGTNQNLISYSEVGITCPFSYFIGQLVPAFDYELSELYKQKQEEKFAVNEDHLVKIITNKQVI